MERCSVSRHLDPSGSASTFWTRPSTLRARALLAREPLVFPTSFAAALPPAVIVLRGGRGEEGGGKGREEKSRAEGAFFGRLPL